MKFLYSLLALFILNNYALAQSSSILNREIQITDFNTKVIKLPTVSYIGRIEIVAKRMHDLFADRDGIVRVMADGVEVGCIQFFSTTSLDYRNFIIDVGRTVRTIEIYNGLNRKIKIRAINKLPARHYGHVYSGNASEVLDISAQLVDVSMSLEHLVSSTQLPRVMEIKLAASDLMNKVRVLGPYKVTSEIKALILLLANNASFIEELKRNQITLELANELSMVELALKRLVD